MKKDIKILLINAINNLVVGIIKMIGGLLFGVNSLIADSLYTFCDFITDIIAIIGSKLSRKRPTKGHPFGFGKVEYITNLFIGMLLIVIGIYIFIHTFSTHIYIPDIYVLGFVLIAIILKIFAIRSLKKAFKISKTPVLLTAIREARIDIFSSICVATVVILLQFSKTISMLKYSDIIGSIIISFLILRTAYELIKSNILHLLGEIEINEDKIKFVEELVIRIYNQTIIKKIELIKYGEYYKAHLILIMNPNMTLKEADILENKITKELKKMKKLNIKYVNIDLDVEL